MLGLDLEQRVPLLLMTLELDRLLGNERLDRSSRLVAVFAFGKHLVAHADGLRGRRSVVGCSAVVSHLKLLALNLLGVGIEGFNDAADELGKFLVFCASQRNRRPQQPSRFVGRRTRYEGSAGFGELLRVLVLLEVENSDAVFVVEADVHLRPNQSALGQEPHVFHILALDGSPFNGNRACRQFGMHSQSWHWSGYEDEPKDQAGWFWRTFPETSKREIKIDAEDLIRSSKLRYHLSFEAWARRDASRREASSAALGAQQRLERARKGRRAESSDRAYEAWLAAKSRSHRPSRPNVSDADKARERGQRGSEAWRSRTWRFELGLEDKFRAQGRDADLAHRARTANFTLTLRFCWLRWRRYCAWRKWLQRKSRERAVCVKRTEARRPSSAAARAALGLRERDKWRRQEWRRVQGVDLRSQNTTQPADLENAERRYRRDLQREQNWVSVL